MKTALVNFSRKRVIAIVTLVLGVSMIPRGYADSTINFESAITPSIRASLSTEQRNDIHKLVDQHNKLVTDDRKKISDLYQRISAHFLSAESTSEQVLSLQSEIESLQREIDIDAAKTVIAIRKRLTSEQRESFVYGDPQENYPGIDLTAAELQNYHLAMRDFLSRQNELNRELANLQYDLKLLYQHPDLDEAALLSKQNEIDQVKAKLEAEKIRLAVKTRALLTPEQRKVVFNRHHPKIWQDTGINAKQDAAIMSVHMKIENADEIGRRALLNLENELARIYSEPLPDEQVVLAKIDQISKVRNETSSKQLGFILEGRSLLTPEQKKRLIGLMKAPLVALPGSHLESVTSINAISGSQLPEFLTDFANVKYLPGSDITAKEPNIIELRRGKALIVTASKTAKARTGNYVITIEPNTVALIAAEPGAVIVDNLHDTKAHCLTVSAGEKTTELLPGTEVIVSKTPEALSKLLEKQSYGRRNGKFGKLGESPMVHSEISIITILQQDELMHRIVMRHNDDDKSIINRAMNTAAALMQSTRSRGPYSR